MKQQSILNKRIPNLLALFLLIAGIAIAIILSGRTAIFRGGAAPGVAPQNVLVANTTDTSFTITYTTSVATTGTVSFGKDTAMGTVVLDDRDQILNTAQFYTTHMMTIKNLTPNTQYYFSIISGDTTYLNNKVPFTATTGPPITRESSLRQVLSGSVVSPEQKSTRNILIYVQLQNAQGLSALTDVQGAYRIPLAGLRSSLLSEYASINNDTPVALTLTDGIYISNVKTTVHNLSLPAIVLSQNYDFTQSLLPTGTQLASNTNFPIVFSIQSSGEPAILIPKDGEGFTDAKPEFRGTAQPDANITIQIAADETIVQTIITADSSGFWTFRPAKPLASGSYTVTITTKDAQGVLQTITNGFTLFPEGSQVFQTATPSATLTPAEEPTQEPTETPTNTPTSTPTIKITPTIIATATPVGEITTTVTPTLTPEITPTEAPTNTPAPTIVLPTPTSGQAYPTPTTAPLPPTGNTSIIHVGIAGIITTIVGFGLFFLMGMGI